GNSCQLTNGNHVLNEWLGGIQIEEEPIDLIPSINRVDWKPCGVGSTEEDSFRIVCGIRHVDPYHAARSDVFERGEFTPIVHPNWTRAASVGFWQNTLFSHPELKEFVKLVLNGDRSATDIHVNQSGHFPWDRYESIILTDCECHSCPCPPPTNLSSSLQQTNLRLIHVRCQRWSVFGVLSKSLRNTGCTDCCEVGSHRSLPTKNSLASMFRGTSPSCFTMAARLFAS